MTNQHLPCYVSVVEGGGGGGRTIFVISLDRPLALVRSLDAEGLVAEVHAVDEEVAGVCGWVDAQPARVGWSMCM